MSRQDYAAIARILRDSSVIKGFDALCYSMADYMGEDNPRFDRQHFLQACSGFVIDYGLKKGNK